MARFVPKFWRYSVYVVQNWTLPNSIEYNSAKIHFSQSLRNHMITMRSNIGRWIAKFDTFTGNLKTWKCTEYIFSTMESRRDFNWLFSLQFWTTWSISCHSNVRKTDKGKEQGTLRNNFIEEDELWCFGLPIKNIGSVSLYCSWRDAFYQESVKIRTKR